MHTEAVEMHAVVVTSAVSNFEAARKRLQEEVVPRVKLTPGFVSGCWLEPVELKGTSVLVFEKEDAARAMAAQMRPGTKLNEFVVVEHVEIRMVAAIG
jgi:hypothetical protein